MYSRFQLARKYIHYLINASNGKGHGIHSPFVFDFVTKVLTDRRTFYCYNTIELLREHLKQNKQVLAIEDLGAGSTIDNKSKRMVADIAKNALKPKKFAQLLFRMVNYYKPENITELGTSLGITTSYLASADKNIPVITMEGAAPVALIAKQNFDRLNLSNVQLIEGNFDKTLPQVINHYTKMDFCFVDGNHKMEPTLRYFKMLIEKVSSNSIFIFDDIHWSREMEDAWDKIKTHEKVMLTIDLFFIGIVFFRPEQKIKQHYIIRF